VVDVDLSRRFPTALLYPAAPAATVGIDPAAAEPDSDDVFWSTPGGLAALVADQDFLTLTRRLMQVPVGVSNLVAVEVLAARQALIAHHDAALLAGFHWLAQTYTGDNRYLPEEAALALGMGASTAAARIDQGTMLVEKLPATHTALAAGRITWGKARTIIDTVKDADPAIYPAVEAAVLPDAPRHTIPALREKCHTAVIALDPHGATERHRKTLHRRTVTTRPLNDGMASLTMFAAAQHINTIYQTCHAMATPHLPGDDRTIGARRADAITDVFTHILHTGTYRYTNPHHTNHQHPETETTHTETDIAHDTNQTSTTDTTPTTTDTGVGTHTETGTGTGTRTETGVGAGTVCAPTDPHHNRPGTLHHPNHRTPVHIPDPTHHTDRPPDPLPTQQGHRPRINITINDTTLLGLDDQPAHLTGHGPITAVQARAIALGGDWYRLITDPTTGTLLDLGRTRYRPNQAIIDYLCARDRTCRWPGCHQPATRTELDHEIHYNPGQPTGGPTNTTNLRCLCPRHHHLRHTPGWTLTTNPDLSLTITTPLGNTHTNPPPQPNPNGTHPLQPLHPDTTHTQQDDYPEEPTF